MIDDYSIFTHRQIKVIGVEGVKKRIGFCYYIDCSSIDLLELYRLVSFPFQKGTKNFMRAYISCSNYKEEIRYRK